MISFHYPRIDALRSAFIVATALTAAFMLAACGGAPPLTTKSAMVPAGVDLTGQWRLLSDAQGDRLTRMSDDILVDVFVRHGKSLKITQTEHALFVSFDRAVVEEYRYGENREVNIGAVEADRVSGWEQGGYVVETRGPERAILVETYRLTDNGRTLTRTVTITDGGRIEYEVREVFERA